MGENYLSVDKFIEYLKEKENIIITKRTLRYYALQGIFPHPAKIGGNKAYYYLDNIPKLKLILLLKSFGKSIKEIRSLINKDFRITEEGLVKLEQEMVDRIAEAVVDSVYKIFQDNKSQHEQHLQKLDRVIDNLYYYDPKADEKKSYFSFISKLTDSLRKYICIIPNNWDKNDFEGLFLVKSILGYNRKVNYEDKEKIKTIKERVKSKVEKLIKDHINALQKEQELLRTL